MSINYKKGDLFLAPDLKERILVHACNAQGIWGSGFALECKDKYPKQYQMYQGHCRVFKNVIGTSANLRPPDAQAMSCLITSKSYGDSKDPVNEILANTKLALICMGTMYLPKSKFISPKFNSGLFGVPWEDTEKILKEYVDKYDLDWDVYSKE